jgi:hypothetical protein
LSKLQVRVIANSAAGTLISSDRSCPKCSSCAVEFSRTATISGQYKGQVELELSTVDQCFALFNSLLLPLLLALVFAFVAEWLLLGEIYGIIAAICGFSLGVLLCKQLKPTALMARQID